MSGDTRITSVVLRPMSTIHEAVRALEGCLAGEIVPPDWEDLRDEVLAHYDSDPSYFFPSWAVYHVGNVTGGFIADGRGAKEALADLLETIGDPDAAAAAARLRVLAARERERRDRLPARARARVLRERATELDDANDQLATRLRELAVQEEELANIEEDLVGAGRAAPPSPEETEALLVLNRFSGPGVVFCQDPADGHLFSANVLTSAGAG